MLPSFDIEGGLGLALLRSLAVTGLLGAFGTLVFRLVCAPRAFDRMPAEAVSRVQTALLWMARYAVALGVAGLLAWLLAEAGDMAGAGSIRQAAEAVPTVFTDTMFGHLIALQLAALLASGLALGRRDHRGRLSVSLAFAGAAVLLQAGHSHAASMYTGPSVLLAAQMLHLLGAGAWLGGLLPLLVLVRLAPPKAGAAAARWFSPMGKLAIGGLTLSSLVQGWVMVASLPGLIGTGYGLMVLVKVALFGVLFAFAVANRYRLAPALLQARPEPARRALVRSIAIQTGFGLAIIAAAGLLSGLVPAMDAQPIWPFPERLTLVAVERNPDLAAETIGAALSIAVALMLLAGALFLRHPVRWVMFAGSAAIAWFAVPNLDGLVVPAYPTTYYQSPTGFSAIAIARGAALYPPDCATCDDGAPGDVPAAVARGETDGDLYWRLSQGRDAAGDGEVMPGSSSRLSADDRWAVIDFIRARAAGETFRTTGAWPQPVPAPGLQAQCADGRTQSLDDLRGGFVRLVAGAAAAEPGVTTILLQPGPAARPGPGLCVVRDARASVAYALVLGRPADRLAGTQILIDDEGWLRAAQTPGGATGWDDPQQLAATIARLRARPIGGQSHMQM